MLMSSSEKSPTNVAACCTIQCRCCCRSDSNAHPSIGPLPELAVDLAKLEIHTHQFLSSLPCKHTADQGSNKGQTLQAQLLHMQLTIDCDHLDSHIDETLKGSRGAAHYNKQRHLSKSSLSMHIMSQDNGRGD